MKFTEYLQGIDDTVLLKAYEEFQECINTGVLSSGEARKIWRNLEENYNIKLSLKEFERVLYYEMATRYYNNKCN